MPDVVSSEAVDEDALYTVVPEQFIATRAGLVKRLRSEGDKAQAARVAKLRRPPLTAWALNQVARKAPALIDALIDAGGQLRAAMEHAVGGDASGLRPARAEERRTVEMVVAEAVRRMEQGGYSATEVMRQRMTATLRAAVVDESVAAPLRQGVLDGDREAPGFGMEALSLPDIRPSGPGESSPESGAGAVQAPPEPQAGPEGPGAAEAEATTPQAPAAQGPAPEAPDPETPDPETPDPVPGAERAQRRQRAQRETARLVAEADALREEADRLTRKAAHMAADAEGAMKRAAAARRRADDALQSTARLLADVDT